MDQQPGGARRRRSPWAVAGIVLAVVLGVCGLVLVAGLILVMVSLNSWADNK